MIETGSSKCGRCRRDGRVQFPYVVGRNKVVGVQATLPLYLPPRPQFQHRHGFLPELRKRSKTSGMACSIQRLLVPAYLLVQLQNAPLGIADRAF